MHHDPAFTKNLVNTKSYFPKFWYLPCISQIRKSWNCFGKYQALVNTKKYKQARLYFIVFTKIVVNTVIKVWYLRKFRNRLVKGCLYFLVCRRMPFYQNRGIYQNFGKKKKLKNFNFLNFGKYHSEKFIDMQWMFRMFRMKQYTKRCL